MERLFSEVECPEDPQRPVIIRNYETVISVESRIMHYMGFSFVALFGLAFGFTWNPVGTFSGMIELILAVKLRVRERTLGQSYCSRCPRRSGP